MLCPMKRCMLQLVSKIARRVDFSDLCGIKISLSDKLIYDVDLLRIVERLLP